MLGNVAPRFLGLIPARGGSKRVPRKNLSSVAGKPLIAWTIEAAGSSKRLDRLILSTDDDEIAALGRSLGVEVPFRRPLELASDMASGNDVILHAVRSMSEHDEAYDYVVVLQPTSPLRTGADIDAAIELLLEKRAHAIVSVCETDHPPEWSNTLPDDLSMRDFLCPDVRNRRSQDLPTSYRLNGAIYIYDCQRLLRDESSDMDEFTYAYVMPRQRSIDIDEAIDLDIAELYLRRHLGQMPS